MLNDAGRRCPVVDEPEYVGLVAATWDLLRGDTSAWPDRPFYKALIERSGQPALDVGCGTGRLLLEYLAQGLDVDGVDVSAEMLAICRARARALGLHPELYEQPMQDLALSRRYRTIIVPSSSFQLVLEPAAAKRTMHRFHDHLEPRGMLAMPFLVLGRLESDVGRSWQVEAVREDGAVVRRHAFARYDRATQLEHTDDVFEILMGGEVVTSERHVRSPATRGYTVAQALALYEEAGFRVDRIVSGFTEGDYQEGDEIFTIVAYAGKD